MSNPNTNQHDPVAAIDQAIERAGGIMSFSSALRVTHQAVYAWRKRKNVPLVRAVEIEALYGVPRTSLIAPELARALEAPAAPALDVL